jgi:hypothetical protein
MPATWRCEGAARAAPRCRGVVARDGWSGKAIAGGCNLHRRIDTLIADAGFRIAQLETGYLKGRTPFSFLYTGLARSMGTTTGQHLTGHSSHQEPAPSRSSRL